MSLFRFVVRNLPLFVALVVLLCLTSDASAGPLLKRIRDRRSQVQCQPAPAQNSPAIPVQAPATPTATTTTATCASGNCAVPTASVRRGLFGRR